MKPCTQCGTSITDDSPQGICARCLLSAAMEEQSTASGKTLATQAIASRKSSFTARQLGPIQLIRQIGKGGMGEVWLGRHELLGRNVAVKFLTRATIDQRDPAFKTFLAGARVAASFEHPGLNKVYDADVEDGVPYLVLELLDGPNLAELVERSGPLDLPTARAVLEAVAGAVAELNQRDLVHRDLKPSNVVLTTEGRVVVTDFGLACARPAAGTGGVGLAGTPAYMAPEMFDGVISAKTDVYALGVTAYHLLAGRPAFHGNVDEQRRQHREVALDVEPLLAARVPKDVIDVILRATSKDALFRPKSPWHVLLSLRAAFDAAGIRGATADELAKALKARAGQAEPSPKKESDDPSSGSSLGTISEMAARKRDLRAAAKRESPAPLPLPPLWTGAEPVAQVIAVSEPQPNLQQEFGPIAVAAPVEPEVKPTSATPAEQRRAERQSIWTARLVAGAAGALATIIVYHFLTWIYTRWNLPLVIESRPGAGGTTVLHMSMPWPAPQWVRYIFFITPPILVWGFAVGSTTLLYRFIRCTPSPSHAPLRYKSLGAGELFRSLFQKVSWLLMEGPVTMIPQADADTTRCGWCQHELRGITTPVCSECGHRIGDQGPDEEGNVPLSRRWGRRIMGWITYPLFSLLITGVVKLAASAAILGVVLLFHLSKTVDRERSYVYAFVVMFLGLTFTLAIYEGIIQLDLTHSGRAWCRVCKSELKDLTEPVCPACRTRI